MAQARKRHGLKVDKLGLDPHFFGKSSITHDLTKHDKFSTIKLRHDPPARHEGLRPILETFGSTRPGKNGLVVGHACSNTHPEAQPDHNHLYLPSCQYVTTHNHLTHKKEENLAAKSHKL